MFHSALFQGAAWTAHASDTDKSATRDAAAAQGCTDSNGCAANRNCIQRAARCFEACDRIRFRVARKRIVSTDASAGCERSQTYGFLAGDCLDETLSWRRSTRRHRESVGGDERQMGASLARQHQRKESWKNIRDVSFIDNNR